MSVTPDCIIGKNVYIPHPELVNLYGCEIGDGCKIAAFVEIQKDVVIGKNCKIEAFAFIPSGVILEDGVFIGPHVCFTNDQYPRAVDKDGNLLGSKDWTLTKTIVCAGAAIGANSTILAGVTIGQRALIGAGSMITKDVLPYVTVKGNPAK